jgi:hypothetical protein
MVSNSLMRQKAERNTEDRMSMIKYACTRFAIGKPQQLFMFCLLLAGVVLGQEQGSQDAKNVYRPDKSKIPETLQKIKAGKFVGVDVDLLAETKATEAIPDLEIQFANSKDTLDKAKIAQALVKLGDKKNTYWDFLVYLATPAVESDAPSPITFNSQGNSVPGISPQFIAWAKANNADATAGEDAIYPNPGKVMLLGATGDRRAIPLLRRALMSPNYLVEAAAAKGIAEIQDKDSIPLIIDACTKAPSEAASLIAESLVYFDDPQAQRAVDMYISKNFAISLRGARARGKTPFH